MDVRPRRQSDANAITESLSQGFLSTFLPSVQETYKRGELQKQLQQAEQILADPNANFEQKQIGLYQTLNDRPDIAKSMYDQFIQTQQSQQKQNLALQQEQQKINRDTQIIRGIEKQRGLPEGSLDEFIGNPQIASNITKPKAVPGGASFQPIPPEYVEAASKVLKENPNASATDLELAFDRAGIPKAYFGSLIESRRRDIEANKKQEEAREANRTSKEKEYFKINEPKLMEIANNQRNLRLEDARYARLENLFSDPSKFPSPFTAALFTKEGQLNDLAYSQLSPEAQESLKLIVDSTSGIKDTYGARVTNFDLQTFLKKLPNLLNSPEGKERVLRDLRAVNEINRLYNSGIQEIFDEAGGSDQIPFSKAERLFNEKYGEKVNELINQFVSPSQKNFKNLPNASQYLGQKIRDDETGEVFISDGKNWKPFGG